MAQETLQSMKTKLSTALHDSEKAVEKGNAYGSAIARLAESARKSGDRSDLEQAAKEMAVDLFSRYSMAGRAASESPHQKIKHLLTGLVAANYTLAPIVTEDMASRLSEGFFNASALVKAFHTSAEHLNMAVSPDKLREWAETTTINNLSDARRLTDYKHRTDPNGSPVSSMPIDELTSTFALISSNERLSDDFLAGVRAGIGKHMQKYAAIDGAEDLQILQRSAEEAHSHQIADILRQELVIG
jgi:hypothetical protein